MKLLARKQQQRRGFTLIEMVMVLVILTALAAMVVPLIDNIRRTSDKATASEVMKQLVENFTLYRIQKGTYPEHLDSLLDATSKQPSTLLAKSGKGIAATLSDVEFAGLESIGIDHVMDFDVLTSAEVYRGRPGNAGVIERDMDASTKEVFVITNADIVASVYPKQVLEDNAFDAATGKVTLESGTARLVAFGVGPRCDAVGQTMQSPPAYPGVSNPATQYNRFLVIFAVYEQTNGRKKRAQIKGAMDSTFDFLNQELNEVEENTIE